MILPFVYGLTYFILGLAVFLEIRESSNLPLGKQLPWLAAFGLTQCLVYWADMFLAVMIGGPYSGVLLAARSFLLPISAGFLICFGAGLIGSAGPLRFSRLISIAPFLFLPLGLLLGYALTVVHTQPPIETSIDVWSRYLFYFPGNVLAAAGFLRQRQMLKDDRLHQARNLLLGAALAFSANGFVSGLVVPSVSYGLAPWLNQQLVLSVTGLPVEVWRMLSAVAVTFFVVDALGVFQLERQKQVEELETARRLAHQATIDANVETCRMAEAWTNALVSISRTIAEINGSDIVLLRIVEMARSLLGADTAVLALWDESGTRLEVKCYATQDESSAGTCQVVNDAIILNAVRQSAARYPQDIEGNSSALVCQIIEQELKTAAIVPLKLENQPFGGLWVGRSKEDLFTATDLIGLERLADQAVIAITHALMADRMQSLAVLEERSRLAREMHDGLAQILGYLRLETQTIEALIQIGDKAECLAHLKQARQNIDMAQADVRESILSLRTTLSGKAGVIAALKEFLTEYGIQTGIDVHYVSEEEDELNLSPIAETQMVRIIQEALTNVRKHSQAQAVQVRLETCNHHLSVTVTDDGVGFDLDPGCGHFGLQMMQERAQSVGGAVTVHSLLGKGTQVELWLPLQEKSYAM